MAAPIDLKSGTPRIRLFVRQDLNHGVAIELPDDQVHYLFHVMRQKAGDSVLLFNGQDGEWAATIETITKRSATLRATSQTRLQDKTPDVWLLFAPIKSARLDYVVQKATELGVAKIWPVLTKRTNARRIKHSRLVANAIEAAEQCNCLNVPEIVPLGDLADVLRNWPEPRLLAFCDESLTAPPALDVFRAEFTGKTGAPWAILIGPEGGFDFEEQDLLRRLPFVRGVNLGPRIMRADTAAVAVLSIWQAILGDWNGA